MIRRSFLGSAALFMLACTAAGAGTLTWSADDPFAADDVIDIDLGASPTAVTAVEFHMVGAYGTQVYMCSDCCDPEGTIGSMTIYPDLLLEADGFTGSALAYAGITSYPAPGEWILTAVPETGYEQWPFLDDGVFTVTKWGHHEPYPFPFPICTGGIGSTPVRVDHLTVTVTYDGGVPAEGAAWGRIKALFR